MDIVLSVLMYGLLIFVFIMPSGDKRVAAIVIAVTILVIDIPEHVGMLSGSRYYLFSICISMCAIACLNVLECEKLASGLMYSAIAAVVINSADWVLYAYSTMINDALYEGVFIVLYFYIWAIMLGRGGFDVVGRIEQYRSGVRDIHHSGSAQSCSSAHHKIQAEK